MAGLSVISLPFEVYSCRTGYLLFFQIVDVNERGNIMENDYDYESAEILRQCQQLNPNKTMILANVID